WLIVAAFLYAKGFIKTGLGRRIAYLLIRGFGGSSLRLGYTLALSDMIIAPATPSNTARAGGILFPIVRSVSNSFGSEPDQG
ncbi:anion permease, partial [Escherichia coli]|nr:anion permease [Escherichia coli]